MSDNANQGDFCGFRVREKQANRQIQAVQDVGRLVWERTVASDAVYRPVKPATLRVCRQIHASLIPAETKGRAAQRWGRAAVQKGGPKQGNDLVH